MSELITPVLCDESQETGKTGNQFRLVILDNM